MRDRIFCSSKLIGPKEKKIIQSRFDRDYIFHEELSRVVPIEITSTEKHIDGSIVGVFGLESLSQKYIDSD